LLVCLSTKPDCGRCERSIESCGSMHGEMESASLLSNRGSCKAWASVIRTDDGWMAGVDLSPSSVGTFQGLPRQIAPSVVPERSAWWHRRSAWLLEAKTPCVVTWTLCWGRAAVAYTWKWRAFLGSPTPAIAPRVKRGLAYRASRVRELMSLCCSALSSLECFSHAAR
jgi:hypothetical protein